MTTCREFGCNRETTHAVVNAPERGYAKGSACREHAEKAHGRVNVSDVRAKDGENA
jgi:hypothetical protein